jgi:outer membrane receptor protein involved in Fe transport
VFYIGERKDVLYASTFPSGTSGIQELSSFIDVNLNGGYHFNDKFSAFLRLNNILNTDYQRFANFNVQGFQFLGGITYKFDL